MPSSINLVVGYFLKVSVNKSAYHRSCFKCSHGGCTISPSNYIAHEGKLYCKHHHVQLFKEKGNYSRMENNGDKEAASVPVRLKIATESWLSCYPKTPSISLTRKRDTNSWNSWLAFLDFSLFLHLFICMYIYDYEDKINPKPNNRLRMGKQNLVPTPKSNVQLTGQKKRKWTKGKPSYCMSTLPFTHNFLWYTFFYSLLA